MDISFKDWLRDLLLWVPRKLWELLLDGLAAVVQAIPVPEFFSGAASAFSSISPGIMYFASAFRLGEGITILVTAYVLRFVIRRIPLIG